MAVAFGSASFATGTAANPAGTEPAGAASGNLLLALVIHENAANAITGPSGWTQLYEGGSPTTSPAGSGFRYWVGWVVRGSSAPALTWTSTANNYYEVHVVRFTGSFNSGSIDASASGTTYTSATPPNPPAATASGNTDMAVAIAVHWNGSNGSWAAPSGYTLRSNNNAGNDGMIATKSLSAAGVEDPGGFTSGTLGSSDAWNGATVLVAEAGTGAPTNTTPPAVTGDTAGQAVVGTVLTADNGSWTNSPTSYSKQWRTTSGPISGATGNSYTIASPVAIGDSIFCRVTATNGVGTSSAVDSNSVLVVAASPPAPDCYFKTAGGLVAIKSRLRTASGLLPPMEG